MYIYSLFNKDNLKEIYVGKTSNITKRLYGHKSCAKRGLKRPLYIWINQIGIENLGCKVELECLIQDVDYFEQKIIQDYENQNYQVLNEQLTQSYNPIENMNNYFQERELVWELYNDTDLPRKEILEHFGISDSLLSKIIKEHGGSNRKGKLYGYYQDIQKAIMLEVPIRELARQYGVAKNSISNINKGITAYDPSLQYPLNQYVREEIIKRFQFK